MSAIKERRGDLKSQNGNDLSGGKRPTRVELAERIDATLSLLRRGSGKGLVKAWLCRVYAVNHRTAERYMARARVRLIEETGQSWEYHRADAYGFYRSIVEDPDVSVKFRLLAQQRIDKLLGLEAPVKVAQTDTEGNDVAMTPEQRAMHIEAIIRDAEGLIASDDQDGTRDASVLVRLGDL